MRYSPFMEIAMKLTGKLHDALNDQIGMEYEASLKYDSIASYFTLEDLPQLAKFFFKQATEERDHAHKLIKFLLDRDEQVRIPEIPAPPYKFKSPVEAVEAAYKSEQKVSGSINKLYELAMEEHDHSTSIM